MLDSMPQTQGLMRGGLGAVSGQPPAAPPSPQGMAAGSSQQGAMNQIMNELVMPSIQEATRAMKRLQERIPVYEDELERQNELFYDQLAPRESSWGDVLGGMAAMAAKVQPAQGSLTPDMGQLLASMGAGAAASRQDFENTEREKAQLRQKTAYTNLAESEKRLGDLTTKAITAMKTGRGMPEGAGMLPNGNVYVKAGDRFVEIIPDKTSEDGYRLKEIVSSGKQITGADTVAKIVEDRLKEWRNTIDWSKIAPEQRAALEAARAREIRAEIEGTHKATTLTPPNVSVAPPSGAAAPTSTEGKPAPKMAVSGLTPQQESQLRGAISAYDADPSETNKKRIDDLWQSFGSAVSAGLPRAKTASEAAADVEKAKAEGKLAGEQKPDLVARNAALDSLNRLEEFVKETSTHPGLEWVHGVPIPFVGNVGTVSGTEAADYKAKLKSLKAQIGFGALQAMREASKTGGALGGITERELDFLQSSLDALDPEMSDAAAKNAYLNILKIVKDMKRAVSSKYETLHPGQAAPGAAAPSDTRETKTVNGVTYEKRGDGKWYRQ